MLQEGAIARFRGSEGDYYIDDSHIGMGLSENGLWVSLLGVSLSPSSTLGSRDTTGFCVPLH